MVRCKVCEHEFRTSGWAEACPQCGTIWPSMLLLYFLLAVFAAILVANVLEVSFRGPTGPGEVLIIGLTAILVALMSAQILAARRKRREFGYRRLRTGRP